MNLYARGSEVNGRTLDVVWRWSSWLIGVEVSRWQMFTDTEQERTVTVHLGPLHVTTWKARFDGTALTPPTGNDRNDDTSSRPLRPVHSQDRFPSGE